MPRGEHVDLDLGGRTVRLSSPDKVMFAEAGKTKLDLVRYYEAVDGPMMNAIGGRPVLMQRFPNGASGSSFFQKRVPDNAPDWLETTIVSTPNGTTSRALVAADIAHIVWAVNLGCLEGRGEVEDHLPVLDRDDPAVGIGPAVAVSVHLEQHRPRRVTRAEEVAVQRMGRPVIVDRVRGCA